MTALLARMALLAAGPLLGLAATASAQAELRGRILGDSGAPVVGATVTLSGVRFTVKTDSLGVFRLTGTPGATIEFAIQAQGFREETQSVVLRRRGVLDVVYRLVRDVTEEPEVNRSGRLLSGRVVDREGQAIAYATLQVNGGRRYVSNDSGRFSVPVPGEGRLTLLLRRIGYEPVEVKLAEMPDTAVRVVMTALATALPAQLVTGRSPFVRLDLGGFYQRMADSERGARVGYFVTPEDLAIRNPINVTDAVEQFPNIRVRPIDDGKADEFGLNHGDGLPLNRKMRVEDRQGCPLTVYLDRVRIQPGSIRAGMFTDEPINQIISPSSVAGIEVYPRAASAPPEFTIAAGTCGLVLIWTR